MICRREAVLALLQVSKRPTGRDENARYGTEAYVRFILTRDLLQRLHVDVLHVSNLV